MKKFSINSLETARKNPAAFKLMLENDKTDGANFWGGRAKSRRWHDAVSIYHQRSDKNEAIQHLIKAFSSRKDTIFNRRELDSLILSLENYIIEYTKLKYLNLEKSLRLSLLITPEIKVTGMIWLINETSRKGYAGYFVGKEVNKLNWESELRFPIIQNFLSEKYHCPLNRIEVGLIDYTTGHHHKISYNEDEIHDAVVEFNKIGNLLS